MKIKLEGKIQLWDAVCYDKQHFLNRYFHVFVPTLKSPKKINILCRYCIISFSHLTHNTCKRKMWILLCNISCVYLSNFVYRWIHKCKNKSLHKLRTNRKFLFPCCQQKVIFSPSQTKNRLYIEICVYQIYEDWGLKFTVINIESCCRFALVI